MAAAARAGEASCFPNASRGLLALADGDTNGAPVHIDCIAKGGLDTWLGAQSEPVRAWVAATQFTGKDGEVCVVPSPSGGIERVACGVEDPADVWAYAGLPSKLPPGVYSVSGGAAAASSAALGWILGSYSFDRYKSAKKDSSGPKARLMWPEGSDRAAVSALAEGFFLARDMITTPAEDMGE